MDSISTSDLKILAEYEGPALSLYLPTNPENLEKKSVLTRLQNHLREVRGRTARGFLSPLEKIIETPHFLNHLSRGLAIFVSGSHAHIFKLPIDFKEHVSFADRFYLKPLLPLFQDNGKFFLLALSQNKVHLFEGNRFEIKEINLSELDLSFKQAQHEHPERQERHHTVKAGRASGGMTTSIHHGKGEGIDTVKEDILRFFRNIDHDVRYFLKDEKAPLVLSGVKHLHSLYQSVNHYKHLAEQGIMGEHDIANLKVLHNKAWELVKSQFNRPAEEAVAKYHHLSGTGKTAATLRDIKKAALEGRIDILFLSQEPQNNDEDESCNFIAIQTLLHGGKIHSMESRSIPENGLAAAILRF